jgi:hypothetical protein
MLLAMAAIARAEQLLFTPDPFDESFFGFGGLTQVDFLPLPGNRFEDNVVVGVGYQRLWGPPGGWRYGGEAGVAARFGGSASFEFWAGVVGRYEFTIFDRFRLSPALTFGFSVASGTLDDMEAHRVWERTGNNTLLFYMAPEISIAPLDNPQLEFFWRTHHRSGAWGTLGNMAGGADVMTVGVRYHF